MKSVGRLRRRDVFIGVRSALARIAPRSAREEGAFRVVHLSIQHDHIHLLVEAEERVALSEGMRALAINLAKQINAKLERKGKVFAHRYHATPITSPRQARHALAYVLNNWRKHREHLMTPGAENALIDPYSTAIHFDGWREHRRFAVPTGYAPLPSLDARPWLLRVGWRRHGDVSVREVPSQGKRQARARG